MADAAPDVAALCEIDAGDALALATRFDRQWAYRGGQALLWNRRFIAGGVHDLYLPVSPLRAFERRGLLRVDGRRNGDPLALFTTRFAADRSCVRDLRFTRTAVRATPSNLMLFIAGPLTGRIGFGDLGLCAVDGGVHADLAVAARGFDLELLEAAPPGGGIGARLVVRAVRATAE